MVDYMYVAHSKFNASNTPKEKITLRQVEGMRWPRPITSLLISQPDAGCWSNLHGIALAC